MTAGVPSHIRPLRRRALNLARGKWTTGGRERQKLSFFMVVTFLAVFGLIILAEVLFMEDTGPSSKVDSYFYEQPTEGGPNGGWESPKPLNPSHRELASDNNNNDIKNEKLKESLRRHQEEMERLIRNISARIHKKPTSPPPPKPFAYENEPLLEFDLSLRGRRGHDATWQPVNGTRHKFYVYSAYYDNRNPQRPQVRVIAATKTKRGDRVYCKMYYRSKTDPGKVETVVVPAGITIIRENWNLLYTAAFVLCDLSAVDKKNASGTSTTSSPTRNAKPEMTRQSPTSASGSRVIKAEKHDTIASDKTKTNITTTTVKPTVSWKSRGVPLSVSIVSGPEVQAVSNQLPVLNHDVGTGSIEVNSTEVGVCVKPLHFHYNKTLELLEFIEFNKLLGVSKFTLYNHTTSESISCILDHYVKEGTVEVLPWRLNIESQKEIRTEGLFAALNDCLYRNMNSFRYLMLIDFDEFIVPHVNNTIPEMLAHVDAQKIVMTGNGGGYGRKVPPQPKLTSAYSFQNAFYYLQFPDDKDASAVDSGLEGHDAGLRLLRKTRRKSKFNPQKQRSKYICIPRNVKEAGNHFIWEFARGSSLNVPTTFGYLHHYRVCEFGGDDCIHTESHVDRRVHYYSDRLVKNVRSVVQKLSDRCQLQELMTKKPTDSDKS